MGKDDQHLLTPTRIQAFLAEHVDDSAAIASIEPLGATTQEGLKAYGYGRPLRVTFSTDAEPHQEVVLRTMSPDPFGHERRADRLGILFECYDTFAATPRHIAPLFVGTVSDDGHMAAVASGEPFLVTTYVDGALYAHDLAREAAADTASARAIERADALAGYLADLHREEASPQAYRRDIRDTVGSGEGIFGLCDSYPADDRVLTPQRLIRLEKMAVDWRWRLKGLTARSRRTHGDFHPFNLVFREGADFSVLDCSRGGAGEPADDITCLTVNYLFMGLRGRKRFDGAMRQLWDTAWTTYLRASGDRAVLDVVAPFFLWRALVLASPVWYPDVPDALRETLIGFAEALLEGQPFQPESPPGL